MYLKIIDCEEVRLIERAQPNSRYYDDCYHFWELLDQMNAYVLFKNGSRS